MNHCGWGRIHHGWDLGTSSTRTFAHSFTQCRQSTCSGRWEESTKCYKKENSCENPHIKTTWAQDQTPSPMSHRGKLFPITKQGHTCVLKVSIFDDSTTKVIPKNTLYRYKCSKKNCSRSFPLLFVCPCQSMKIWVKAERTIKHMTSIIWTESYCIVENGHESRCQINPGWDSLCCV